LSPLRWAGVAFLVAGAAAAPLNLLHAQWFSGAELARVPLVRSGPTGTPQSYPSLIINLKPEQSPVAVILEAEIAPPSGNVEAANRYLTHLINGNQIAAKAETVLRAGSGTPHAESLAVLRSKINSAGLYTVLLSEATAPAIAFTKATLSVRANTRRADMINVLAGFALMMIGTVTLFATGKRRVRSKA
jgi:hypothetical protein